MLSVGGSCRIVILPRDTFPSSSRAISGPGVSQEEQERGMGRGELSLRRRMLPEHGGGGGSGDEDEEEEESDASDSTGSDESENNLLVIVSIVVGCGVMLLVILCVVRKVRFLGKEKTKWCRRGCHHDFRSSVCGRCREYHLTCL